MTPWRIRQEAAGDEPAISALVSAAFRDAAHSNGAEAGIVEHLRNDGDLALSLVAEGEDGAMIGHAALSPVHISCGVAGWYGLGPVAVLPVCQRAGIGTALVDACVEWLRESGAGGCVVLGDPAYYGRFGFAPDPGLTYSGAPAEYFQMLAWQGLSPVGEVHYAPAFG